MVSRQFHYIKRNVFMPFLSAEILNYQGSAHFIGVGSLSYLFFHFLLTSFPKCGIVLFNLNHELI